MASQDSVNRAKAVLEKWGLSLSDEISQGEAVLETARKQAVKYGFLALTRSADALAGNGQGIAIRKNIAAVWNTQASDDGMVKYLG